MKRIALGRTSGVDSRGGARRAMEHAAPKLHAQAEGEPRCHAEHRVGRERADKTSVASGRRGSAVEERRRKPLVSELRVERWHETAPLPHVPPAEERDGRVMAETRGAIRRRRTELRDRSPIRERRANRPHMAHAIRPVERDEGDAERDVGRSRSAFEASCRKGVTERRTGLDGRFSPA